MTVVKMVKETPTAGSLRAALKIVRKLEHGGSFGVLEDIAEIIDRETALPTALKTLEGIRDGQYQLDGTPRVDGFGPAPWIVNLCEQALGEVSLEGEKRGNE